MHLGTATPKCGRCCNTVFTLGANASATVNNLAVKAKKTD